MGLPRQLAASLASAAARRRRTSVGRNTMTAVGRGFVATLSTDMRGPVVSRKAETREAAFADASRLLDDAERQQSVAIAQSEE
jgi:hypothetical protein